jgi:hypothetical protein
MQNLRSLQTLQTFREPLMQFRRLHSSTICVSAVVFMLLLPLL